MQVTNLKIESNMKEELLEAIYGTVERLGAELIFLGRSPAFAVRHTAVQADGALLWFVRNVKRLAHGLGRI